MIRLNGKARGREEKKKVSCIRVRRMDGWILLRFVCLVTIQHARFKILKMYIYHISLETKDIIVPIIRTISFLRFL